MRDGCLVSRALKATVRGELSLQLQWETRGGFEPWSDILGFHLKRFLWLLSEEQVER